jgi:hypothetical protein
MGWGGARVLLGSVYSRPPGACSCTADITSDLLNALPNNPVYLKLGIPQLELSLFSINVVRRWGHSHFCQEATYWCGLVVSSDGSAASVFIILKFISNLFLEEWYVRGGPSRNTYVMSRDTYFYVT